jgi:signal transduction histidine kinase
VQTDSHEPKLMERDEAGLTEVAYHRKLNLWVVLFATPFFVSFAFFHLGLGNYFQSVLYGLLSINAIAGLALGAMIADVDRLILLKRSSGAVAFGLLSISVVAGTLSKDIYIFVPWIFTVPVGITLFFGKRIGVYSAIAFTVAAIVAVFYTDLPAWEDAEMEMFRINTALSLFSVMSLSLIGEKIRVRVQKDLVASQQQYKSAEARQREANVKLQHEIDLRIESEKLLSQSEMRYRALFEESAVSLWEEDWSQLKIYLDELPREAADDLPAYFNANPGQLDVVWKMMRITCVNRATLALYGADTTATLLNSLTDTMPAQETRSYLTSRIIGLYRAGRFQTELHVRRLDGAPLHILISSTIPAGFQTSWEKVFSSVYDVTERVDMEEERKRVEKQLNEARQMQAIATMAGGIAHQFNNALAAIYGNVDLIAMDPPSPRTKRYIDSLRKSSDRMSMLTDQLLAYARGGKYRPRDFSVNELIETLLSSDRIERAPSTRVSLKLAPDIYTTNGDTAQIEMVIEAVVSNALESMDRKGELAITTGNLKIDAGSDHPVDLGPGDYALIQVRDSGTGMDEQIRKRIFEPFFTTKIFGRGLGMAAAYGIVQNHNGLITVASEPGRGTCVTIYLPGETDTGNAACSAA